MVDRPADQGQVGGGHGDEAQSDQLEMVGPPVTGRAGLVDVCGGDAFGGTDRGGDPLQGVELVGAESGGGRFVVVVVGLELEEDFLELAEVVEQVAVGVGDDEAGAGRFSHRGFSHRGASFLV